MVDVDDPNEPTQHIKVPYRPWWVPITATSVGLLVGAVAMTATLIIVLGWAREGRQSDDVIDCNSRWSALVDEAEHQAENADNRLTVVIARESLNPAPASENVVDRIAFSIEAMAEADDNATKILEDRRAWLDAGSPLPCPVT